MFVVLGLRRVSKLTDAQQTLMKKSLPKVKPIPNVKRIVLVSSAKGGVGKSTVAANLAVALLQSCSPNKTVGLLDLDVFGPSQPRIFGLEQMIPEADESGRLQPLTNYGVDIMSMGFLQTAEQRSSPVAWRGLMVMGAVERLLYGVAWTDSLDCLVVDLPPGTGDVHLTVAQRLGANISGAVIVSTPQALALDDARRGLALFRLMKIPVLGLVKNMSYFECPGCHERHQLFGPPEHEDDKDPMNELEVLAEFPLEPALCRASDSGKPITATDPTDPVSGLYISLATAVWRGIH